MKYRVWDCKIVIPADSELPHGFDQPPRRAAINAVLGAGFTVISCFSGWDGELTEIQDALVDKDVVNGSHY